MPKQIDVMYLGKLALIGYVGSAFLGVSPMYGAAGGAAVGYLMPSSGGTMDMAVNVGAGASAGLLASDVVNVSPMVGAAAGGAGAYFLLQ